MNPDMIKHGVTGHDSALTRSDTPFFPARARARTPAGRRRVHLPAQRLRVPPAGPLRAAAAPERRPWTRGERGPPHVGGLGDGGGPHLQRAGPARRGARVCPLLVIALLECLCAGQRLHAASPKKCVMMTSRVCVRQINLCRLRGRPARSRSTTAWARASCCGCRRTSRRADSSGRTPTGGRWCSARGTSGAVEYMQWRFSARHIRHVSLFLLNTSSSVSRHSAPSFCPLSTTTIR